MTFSCQECGKRFRTVAAAERASNNGCPQCGGCDVDLDVSDLKSQVVNRKPASAEPVKDSLHLEGF